MGKLIPSVGTKGHREKVVRRQDAVVQLEFEKV
jgi:hypothetical protein